MYIFIDESGDAGFKLTKGSSPVFVIAMVIFDNIEDMSATEVAIKQLNPHKAFEYKFSKSKDSIRDEFFSAIMPCKFKIRTMVVKKETIYSKLLREDTKSFYSYFVKQLLKYNQGTIQNAKIIIDGSGDKEFKQQLTAYIRRETHTTMIKKFVFADSKSDILIQLADMIAGAIARSYYSEKKNSNRWKIAIEKKITNLWDFK